MQDFMYHLVLGKLNAEHKLFYNKLVQAKNNPSSIYNRVKSDTSPSLEKSPDQLYKTSSVDVPTITDVEKAEIEQLKKAGNQFLDEDLIKKKQKSTESILQKKKETDMDIFIKKQNTEYKNLQTYLGTHADHMSGNNEIPVSCNQTDEIEENIYRRNWEQKVWDPEQDALVDACYTEKSFNYDEKNNKMVYQYPKKNKNIRKRKIEQSQTDVVETDDSYADVFSNNTKPLLKIKWNRKKAKMEYTKINH